MRKLRRYTVIMEVILGSLELLLDVGGFMEQK